MVCPTLIPTQMVGESPCMDAVRQKARALGSSPASILITGETGVGKELAARLIHDRSARARRPFVAVNCAALPPQLAGAELFGAVAGAYTGARARDGLFQEAHGGTLFLDEIGELDPHTQGALLRVLETGRLRKMGATRDEAVDVRVVCATHRDLLQMVRAGGFRADLYHRVAALRLNVPPLRERLGDLPELARALAPQVAGRLQPSAWARLRAHPWPGNVRELRNVLARAGAEQPEGPIQASGLTVDPFEDAAGPPAADGGPLELRIARLVAAELRRHAGNVRRTAQVLAVSPTTVYRYLNLAAQ